MRKIIIPLLIMLAAASAHAQTVAPTTNGSITITTGTGTTFQQLLPAVTGPTITRRSLTIQNNNPSDSCWIFIGSGAATKATSILLTAGGSYTRYSPYIPSDQIQVNCATAGDTVYVDTQ